MCAASTTSCALHFADPTTVVNFALEHAIRRFVDEMDRHQTFRWVNPAVEFHDCLAPEDFDDVTAGDFVRVFQQGADQDVNGSECQSDGNGGPRCKKGYKKNCFRCRNCFRLENK